MMHNDVCLTQTKLYCCVCHQVFSTHRRRHGTHWIKIETDDIIKLIFHLKRAHHGKFYWMIFFLCTLHSWKRENEWKKEGKKRFWFICARLKICFFTCRMFPRMYAWVIVCVLVWYKRFMVIYIYFELWFWTNQKLATLPFIISSSFFFCK